MSARSIALSPDSIEVTLYRRGRYRHHIALVNCAPALCPHIGVQNTRRERPSWGLALLMRPVRAVPGVPSWFLPLR